MATRRKAPRQMKDLVRWTKDELKMFGRRRSKQHTGEDPALTALGRRWLVTLDAEPVARRLRVVWNSRLQTTAGTACMATGRIELNPRLRNIGISQIHRTLKHEAAHLLARWRAGRRPIRIHGAEWRKACEDLGIPGEPAFHNLPFPRRRVARNYTYQCPNCGVLVKRVRKFTRYTACYRCCRRYSGGVYDARFQFERVDPPRTGAR